MTIVNAADATEAVFISPFSNQFDFDGQGAALQQRHAVLLATRPAATTSR